MTVLLTAVLAAGILAGCSEKTPGTGTGTTTPSTGEQTSSQPTDGGSSTGLSIAKFVSKPCDTLTAAQITKLGSVKPGETENSVLGPGCSWNGQDVTKNSTYSVSVTQDKPVEDMVNNVKGFSAFTDHKVDGQRFVTADEAGGELDCLTLVEVSKTDSVTIQVSIAAAERATKKPCTESETVAKMVVENLKG